MAWSRRCRAQAGQLLATSAAAGADRPVVIADRWLAGPTMAAAGALEIAVHGWDIAEACHRRRPIPPGLATSILAVVPLVVSQVTRGVQFSDPVAPELSGHPRGPPRRPARPRSGGRAESGTGLGSGA